MREIECCNVLISFTHILNMYLSYFNCVKASWNWWSGGTFCFQGSPLMTMPFFTKLAFCDKRAEMFTGQEELTLAFYWVIVSHSHSGSLVVEMRKPIGDCGVEWTTCSLSMSAVCALSCLWTLRGGGLGGFSLRWFAQIPWYSLVLVVVVS